MDERNPVPWSSSVMLHFLLPNNNNTVMKIIIINIDTVGDCVKCTVAILIYFSRNFSIVSHQTSPSPITVINIFLWCFAFAVKIQLEYLQIIIHK